MLQNNLTLALMAGIDIPIPELALTIHPPRIKEIAFMGEDEFFQGMQLFLVKKENVVQDEAVLQTISNFEVLMKIIQQPEKKEILSMFLLLLFPEYEATILPGRSIFLSREAEQSIVIDEAHFPLVQLVTSRILCASSIFQESNIVYNAQSKRAKEIEAKLMKGRKKVAEIKSKENQNGGSVLARYISILTLGVPSMSVDDCVNLTLFQMFDLMERLTSKLDWDTDLRLRLAGGKPEREVESWMKDLHPKI